ncbi:UNVERIFIED_CONTAM: hypothetical protein FKN15_017677 [Acipenser sinensis]
MTAKKILSEGAFISISDVTVALCAVLVILFVLKNRKRERKNLIPPPGPTPWLVIGNMLQMGDKPHISLTLMREKYGDVFQVKLGSLLVVVLSGIDTVKQALVRQGESFAGRPDLYTFSAVADGTSMTFSEKYGEGWILHKKICKTALRTFSQTEAKNSTCSCLLEEQICSEASEVVDLFMLFSRKEGCFDPAVPIISSVANVVCALCFGKRYDYNDKEFLTLVQINNEVLKGFATGNVADFFPVLRYLPTSPAIKTLVQYIKRMNSFMERNIEEHLNTFDKNCIRDITDALIAKCEGRHDEGKKALLSNKQIVHTVIDIFGAAMSEDNACLPATQVCWSKEETSALRSIVSDLDVLSQLDRPKQRNKHVYQQVVDTFSERGI